MISEKDFAAHFSSFWRESMPNMESVVRSLNAATTTEWPAIGEVTDPNRRDLIAETAFECAAMTVGGDQRPFLELVPVAAAATALLLEALPERRDPVNIDFSSDELEEIAEAQTRILDFARGKVSEGQLTFRPRISGHGMIGECAADISTTNGMYELKYVNRNFRSYDFRQVIVYTSLRYLSQRIKTNIIGIVNPFRGVMTEIKLDEFVKASSGREFDDFIFFFSYYLSSGEISR